jgi:cytochrome c oxidase subunit 4
MNTQDRSNHYNEEPHDVTKPMPHHEVPYLTVFVALLILTIVTVGIGIYLRFQNELVNVLLALLIAATKATLVSRNFMHLKFEGKLIRMIFLVPLGLCVLLVIALLPDIVMTHENSSSASLKLFNTPPMLLPSEAHH